MTKQQALAEYANNPTNWYADIFAIFTAGWNAGYATGWDAAPRKAKTTVRKTVRKAQS